MTDLLVSYSWSHFYRARPEIVRILKRFGDPDPRVEKTGMSLRAGTRERLMERYGLREEDFADKGWWS